MREYDLIADWYPTDRNRTFGVAEALAVADPLPAHSRILDIGCGNGVPITEALVNAGHRVVGLDSSAGMLVRFRVNLPGTLIVRGDARRCPFVDGCFDAAISWGMIFSPYARGSGCRVRKCVTCAQAECAVSLHSD